MRKCCVIIFVLFVTIGFGQTNLLFDEWVGEGVFYEIQDERLILNAPKETGKRVWTYPSNEFENTKWEIDIQLDFAPSLSNALDFYVMADQKELESANAYFLHWGSSGSEDVLIFYKRTNGAKQELVSGSTILAEGGEIHLSITRNDFGFWQIFLNDTLEMTVFDDELINTNFVGLLCSHTSTRANSFSFDNLKISEFIDVEQEERKQYDVVFTEFMIDENPSIFLPESQFIELYNRTNNTINLEKWQLVVNGKSTFLPSHQLKPDEYIILFSKEDSTLWNDGITLDNWQDLKDKEGNISLRTNKGVLIDEFVYHESLIESSHKENGGWSLERKDINFFCDIIHNWGYSIDQKGGTPNHENSIQSIVVDDESPVLLSTYVMENNLVLSFNEEVVSSDFVLGSIIYQSETLTLSFDTITTDLEEIEINVRDCIGNNNAIQLEYARPQKPKRGDIFISEILVDPLNGGEEFIELYNASNFVLDFSNTKVGTKNEEGEWKELITLDSALFLPKTYWIISKSKESILDFYNVSFPNQIMEAQLPTLTNSEGIISVLNGDAELLDEFSYSENLHYSLLENTKGVSLERLSFDLETNDNENWNSASELIDWGSPTTQNSQFQELTNKQGASLTNDILSLNRNQELAIQFQEESDWVASFSVYFRNGYKVASFGESTYIAKNGIIHWDLMTSSSVLTIGFYIVVIEMYNEKGDSKLYKLPFVITE
ncbi:MAG: lamin tail domain-containing protein [Cytophagales bacterium]|nr:lamin tail domain-containing protein [Cytophagales bacterium]